MASENEWHADREAALDLIIEATLRPEAWNDFIAHVCKVVGANSGAMAIRSSQPALELIDPVAATGSDEVVEAYLTYPREADPVIIGLTVSMFALRNGKSFITQEMLDDKNYRRTPFFNDFADKFDIAYLTGVSVDVGADHSGTLMLYREDGSSVFGQHERRFIESLVKPLRIGLETRRQLTGNHGGARRSLPPRHSRGHAGRMRSCGLHESGSRATISAWRNCFHHGRPYPHQQARHHQDPAGHVWKFKAAVQNDLSEGAQLGLTGTPAFFINGRELSGAQPLEAFTAILDEELALTR